MKLSRRFLQAPGVGAQSAAAVHCLLVEKGIAADAAAFLIEEAFSRCDSLRRA